ncbi:putative 26S proteasome regulatory subunit rpn6 [Leucoagaricus sp. SymC.cos]|nr:putative 26S proteasome regulatory subunit rpn6 [Leucoagaricus sp. SymC.cos]
MSPTGLLAQAEANPASAGGVYKQILAEDFSKADAQLLRDKETVLVKLGELYRDQKGWDANALAEVIALSRSLCIPPPKYAKNPMLLPLHTARLPLYNKVRTLLDCFSAIPNSRETKMNTITDNIAWAKAEKRVFLKHSLETRLVGLQLESQQFQLALMLIDNLLTELKRLDDKMILTEVHLLESRVYHGTSNLSKAQAALTSSRTAANSIYYPPTLQASLDLQSGILHAEDKGYTTAYSYFFESFENLSDGALDVLKYMLLCKVMLNLPEDVTSLLTDKLAVKYVHLRDVESMQAIARAHKNGTSQTLRRLCSTTSMVPLTLYLVPELSSNPAIRSHLAALYDTLLEQNLLRIIEPYSVVEISHVASLVGQGQQAVEAKLSQMILDKVFHGVLDQGRGCLLVFDEPEVDVSTTSLFLPLLFSEDFG